jgi:PD-(D/E)XK nuclease superfamily protein
MDLFRESRNELSTHPVDVGLRSEGAIFGALIKRGISVLVPWGSNHRYDLVIEADGRFLRGQCKTGRLKKGAVLFKTRSVRTNMYVVESRSYEGEVDVFLVYCPETDRVYVVPVEFAPFGGTMSLRVEPAANNQSERIHWASEFELPG